MKPDKAPYRERAQALPGQECSAPASPTSSCNRAAQLRPDSAALELGSDVQLRQAAALAGLTGLTGPAAARAADALAVAEVLRPGRPLEFVHTIVRAAVRDGLPAGERIALHRRAAEILLADGASSARVGVHLLATDPGGVGVGRGCVAECR